MGGWIKWRKDLEQNPKVLTVAAALLPLLKITAAPNVEAFSEADALNLFVDAMEGGVSRFWSYCDRRVTSGDKLPIPADALPAIMGLPMWIIRLFPPEWIAIGPDGSVTVPDYCERNHLTPYDKRKEKRVRKRIRDRDRQRAKRARDKRATHGVTGKRHNGDNSRDSGVQVPDTEDRSLPVSVTALPRTDGEATDAGLGGPAPPPPRKPGRIKQAAEWLASHPQNTVDEAAKQFDANLSGLKYFLTQKGDKP